MKPKLYFTIFATVFFGVIAGYGAISVSRIIFRAIATTFDDKVPEYITDVTSDIEMRTSTNDPFPKSLMHRAINYVTRTGEYHVIDSDMKLPYISAESYLVADLDNGEVILKRDSFVEKEIASVTKLMTALVTLKNIDQGAIVPVSYTAVSTYGTQGGLRSGEKIPVPALLRAMMLQSSNDATEVLAEFAGRFEFLLKMNSEAEYLGMQNTRYVDPSGLSEENKSSADDLFRLAQYIYKSYPELVDITKENSYRYGSHLWYNNSVFANDPRYIGGKNGYTDTARYTLVAFFELPIGENSEPKKVAIILLDGEQNEKDARAIILYLLRNVEFY